MPLCGNDTLGAHAIHAAIDSSERPANWWTARCAVELFAAFALFAGLMHFIYLGPEGIAPLDRGLPGHDSFYHVKMALLLPEIGLVDRFPWLRTTVFNDRFVNHHYGFQWLLSPFVRLADRCTGDPAAGGRWFVTASFGVSMAVFQLVLMLRGVRHRWVWLVLCLLLPVQFYSRQYFVRAINPSLICMLLLCFCLFARKPILTAIVIAGSIQVYLGAVTFAPVLVGAVFVSGLVGVFGDLWRAHSTRREVWSALRDYWGWKLAGWAVVGWIVGLAVHPYGGLEVLSFLKLQVLGSGLSPDIAVGREWKSYTPAWFFVNMSGVTLAVTGIAVCLRMRLGPRLSTNEFALLLMNVLFLVLTLKARRFIEYWPIFATLSAAYLVCPVFRRSERTRVLTGTTMVLVLVGVAVAIGLSYRASSVYGCGRFLAEWRWWGLLVAMSAACPIAHCWVRGGELRGWRDRGVDAFWTLATGMVLCVAVSLLLYLLAGDRAGAARLRVPWWFYVTAGLVYVAAGWVRRGFGDEATPGRWRRAGLVVATVVGVVALIAPPAGAMFVGLQDDTRCMYDMPALRAVMAKLESVSREAAVVFTDDWDVFPVYFYLNHRNHYVVGLDPKFSHEKDPVLWERYVQISRGKTPVQRTVDTRDGRRLVKRTINVRLADIRDRFDAEFVIVDQDHRSLARKLDATPTLAERIFPERVRRGEKPPYLLYRILPRN